MKKPDEVAEKLLGVPYESLDERSKKVARRYCSGRKAHCKKHREGVRCKDNRGSASQQMRLRLSAGSWTFIAIFAAMVIEQRDRTAIQLRLEGGGFPGESERIGFANL